jgi:signal transduction histidine kinase
VLAPAHAALEATVTQQWTDVDAAEKPVQGRLQLGLVLVMLGVLAAAFSGELKGKQVVAVPAAIDTHAMEDVLRERLEALYQAHSKLDDNARFAAFGELAAALSHGLKTPLAGVQASVQLAQLKLGENSPAREELDEVLRLTEGLTEQVQRFLRAAGQVGPTRQRLSLSALLAALEKAYAEESKRRGITFSVKAPAEELAVQADASLLDMAVRNLVENALAVVKGGQAVTVSAERCAAPTRVGLEGQAPAPGTAWCALVVDDEGPGLPEAARRTQAGASTRESGSGLGLAIARRVAERHDGALSLEDRPGGGTRIRVVLPLAGETS